MNNAEIAKKAAVSIATVIDTYAETLQTLLREDVPVEDEAHWNHIADGLRALNHAAAAIERLCRIIEQSSDTALDC